MAAEYLATHPTAADADGLSDADFAKLKARRKKQLSRGSSSSSADAASPRSAQEQRLRESLAERDKRLSELDVRTAEMRESSSTMADLSSQLVDKYEQKSSGGLFQKRRSKRKLPSLPPQRTNTVAGSSKTDNSAPTITRAATFSPGDEATASKRGLFGKRATSTQVRSATAGATAGASASATASASAGQPSDAEARRSKFSTKRSNAQADDRTPLLAGSESPAAPTSTTRARADAAGSKPKSAGTGCCSIS